MQGRAILDQQTTQAVGQEQALVRVHHHRVAALDSVQHATAVPGEQEEPAVGRVDMQPAALRARAGLLQHAGDALERIDRGIYGLCESCGSAIPEARLEAKPSVSLCLSCQEAHEA